MDSQYNTYPERLEFFRNQLRRTDFAYNYADDPRAYRDGEKSVNDARAAMRSLLSDFPEKKEEVENLYSSFAGDRVLT